MWCGGVGGLGGIVLLLFVPYPLGVLLFTPPGGGLNIATCPQGTTKLEEHAAHPATGASSVWLNGTRPLNGWLLSNLIQSNGRLHHFENKWHSSGFGSRQNKQRPLASWCSVWGTLLGQSVHSKASKMNKRHYCTPLTPLHTRTSNTPEPWRGFPGATMHYTVL